MKRSFNRLCGIAIALMVISVSQNSVAQYVAFDKVTTTCAGNGVAGYADGSAGSSQFFGPTGLSVDAAGNIYVADNINRSIVRKITPAGVVSTVAGTGVQGYSTGTVATANFALPTFAAMVGTSLYVADNGNHQLREISGGNVYSFVGSTTYGFLDGVGTAAQFNQPHSFVLDGLGNMYVTDIFNHAIRKVHIASKTVTTIAGNGTAGFADGTGSAARFSSPFSIDIDADGNLIVADFHNSSIRKVTPAGVVTTIAGNGTDGYADGAVATALFNQPAGVSVASDGSIYVADTYNNCIRKISNGIVYTISGSTASGYLNGFGSQVRFYHPYGLDTDAAGNIYITDNINNVVRKISSHVIPPFTTVEGLATLSTEFGVSGKNLTGNLIVTAPTGFEVSLDWYTGFSSSLSLTPTSGTVGSIQLYVRVSAAAVAGSYDTNIEINSSGASTQYLNVKATVNPNTATPVILNGLTVTKYTKTATSGYLDGTVDQAMFYGIRDMAVDLAGNTYIADYQNHKIRKITPAGIVSTFAGSTSGYADGIGTAAQFKNPSGVAVDNNGNVYVADQMNNRIRKILPNGTVSTIAGSGVLGNANGVGTAAQFNYPYKIAVDASGILYVTQLGSVILRKIAVNATVSDFVSNFNYPAGVACDLGGNLYVCDQSNQRICRVSPAGTVTQIAGVFGSTGSTDGVGSVAKFNYPIDLTVDITGNVFVADFQNNCLRKITPTGMVVTIGRSSSFLSGNSEGSSTVATFTTPSCVAVKPDGTILLASTAPSNGGYIFKITEPYTLTPFTTVSGSPSYSQAYPAIAGTSNNVIVTAPAGFEVGLNQSVFSSSISIAQFEGSVSRTSFYVRVSAAALAGTITDSITLTSVGSNTVKVPVTATVGSNGGVVYFERTVSTKAGTTAGYQDGPVATAQFQYVRGVVSDAAGNVFVADRLLHCIRKITPDGTVSTFAGTNATGFLDGNGTAARFNTPYHLAIDASGNIYVSDNANHSIRKITPSGVVSTLAGNGTQGYADGTGSAARFNQPFGIAVDASGNVFVADNGNHRIRKITAAGVVTTVAGNGLNGYGDAVALEASLSGPRGLALAKNGDLFIVDGGCNCIRKLTTNGFVNTFAGSSSTGDVNGPAVSARFNNPYAVAVDTNGMVYVADGFNYKIKQITPGGVVTTLAGTTIGTQDGPANTAKFKLPAGISCDANNNIYVADENSFMIRKVGLPSLSFATNIGIPSAAQSFRVSASKLTGNMTVTAPVGYEVSFVIGSGYASSVSVVPTTGTITNQLIYIRLAAPSTAGTYSGNIVLSAVNAAPIALAVTGVVPASKIDQTITFDALADRTFGGGTFTLAATASSGLTVTYTSSNPAVATVSGNTVTIVGGGSTIITANQSGDVFYNAAPAVPQTLTIQKATQTITFNALAAKTFGNAPFNPGATASSGLTISYSSSNTLVATVSGTTVTIVGAGTADITASQAGNANYHAATSVVQTLTVNKASQTITFGVIAAKTYGGANFNLTATASSGLTVAYTSSNPAVATVSGNTVTIVGVGTTDITASQVGNTNYNPASDVIRTLTVNKANQTITFAALAAKTYGDPDFTLSGTSTSGLTITYTSSNTAVATVTGNLVTIVGVGTTNITASQTGNVNYNAATNVVRALVVNKAAQTITFGILSNKMVGDADFTLTGTASSGLTITYISSDPTVATISGTTVTIVGAGSTNITASQSGNANYNAATDVVRSLTVNKINQAITFDPIADKFIDDASFSLGASSTSGLVISYASSNTSVATVSGNIITIVGLGTTTIIASQGGNTNVNAAVDVSHSFSVVKHDQIITFESIADKYVNDTDFTLNATSNSATPITFSSSNPLVATVSGNTVTIIGAGTAVITANQASDGIYYAASATQTLVVNKLSQFITFAALPTKSTADVDFTLNAVASSGLTVTYTSSNPAVATVSGNTVSIVGAGTTQIIAAQSGDASYDAASDVTQNLVVSVVEGILTAALAELKIYPNPVSFVLYIEPKNTWKGEVQISITNNLGVELYSFKENSGQLITADFSALSSGFYFIKISNGAESVIEKIIKP